MKVMFDLNVLLDVLQKRDPHYAASATAVSLAISGAVKGYFPGHALTTLAYVLRKVHSPKSMARILDRILRHAEIYPAGKGDYRKALMLAWEDFEDAVVAATAEAAGCKFIITRNLADFRNCPVPALTPEEFLVSPGISRKSSKRRH